MKFKIFLVIAALFLLVAAKNDKPAYRIFNAKGRSMSYADLLDEAKKADVVFFGEIHDNPVCHWLELQLTKDLYKIKKEKLILGAEMFETDNSLLLKEYISKMIRKKDFEAEAKLWPNYKTDYAPIVDFASEHGIKFIATNIPRRFAAIVNLKGFEGLDSIMANERGLIASLPIKYNPQLGCYKNMLDMMGPEAAAMHMGDNIAKAQAIKDATMGQTLFKNLDFGQTILHFNGSYHSDNYEGIVWYLKEFNKRTSIDLKILTISSVEQADLDDLSNENLHRADFILCFPEDMIKSQVPSGTTVMPPMPKTMPAVQNDKPATADTSDTDMEVDEDDD
ncbi:MAG: ChaN family lipoprotein [Bacteroidetes bacterium]|nr:ChaN family lipoprotein [Bacteroidota bacterium]